MNTDATPTDQLEKAFQGMGLSAESASVAALGRAARPTKGGSLVEAAKGLGLSQSSARTFARGRSGISETVTKAEPAGGNFAGGNFPASDYAYVGDAEDPSTFELLLTKVPGGEVDPDAVRSAVLAIDPSTPSPNPVPEDQMAGVISRLAKAWKTAGLPADEMPAILNTNEEALRRAFSGLGLSENAAAIAASGRERRRGR